MAEVLNLNGTPVEPEVPYDGGLVDLLERAIVSVKSGEVHSVAVILVRNAELLEFDTSFQGRRLEIIAGASRLIYRLHAEMEGVHCAQ